MPQYNSPRGTYDILPDDQAYWRRIIATMHHISDKYGYGQLDTPIFEDAMLFLKGISEGTDIHDKEMYVFKDRGEDLLALRPEFTAGVVRAYIEHGMHTRPQPVKLYSLGPIFRYDRPQAGRYRQFWQYNVEAVGSNDPAADFEVMSVAWDFYETLGLKGLSFQVNSIGDRNCRPNYVKALQEYYRAHIDEVCEDDRKRIEVNPLRVLDCKVEKCQPVIAGAPKTVDYLCDACAKHFASLRRYLENAGRPYTINHRLVRGLDYYTHTVFEVWATSLGGSQAAVCGGGRYDYLIETLGGKPTPSVGFAAGLDRVWLAMKEEGITPPPLPTAQVLVAYMGEAAKDEAVRLVQELRAADVRAVMTFDDRSFKAQMRQAEREGVQYALIIGEQELAESKVAVKPMGGGEQSSVARDGVLALLKEKGIAP
ncbi:MAG: histidine--tRNA ligase [Chloroflexi bacterium]|nr:histidine--tRNA ligase [Chloroflexota bacterium]